MMSFNRQAQLPAVTRTGRAIGHRLAQPPPDRGCESPRVLRMPAGWWDVPSAVGCRLDDGPRSASAARRVTRNTLLAWGLAALAADAETIVGELAANAVTHGAALESDGGLSAEPADLRLLRRAGEVICAVLDASGALPVLRPPGAAREAGRGLRMVDTLSDIWGWSPVPGRGKAVWAILFRPEPLGDASRVPPARRHLTCVPEHDADVMVSWFLPGRQCRRIAFPRISSLSRGTGVCAGLADP
jgi:hypothetical protein